MSADRAPGSTPVTFGEPTSVFGELAQCQHSGCPATGAIEGRLQLEHARMKLALAQAREAEQRLQLALWASGEAVWSWDAADSRFRVESFQRNDAEVALQPLRKDELLALLHPDDVETFRLSWRMHLSGLRSDLDVAFRLHLPEGERWVRARGRALERDPDGSAHRVVGTIKDITAQREAEASLHLMAQAFSSTRDAIAVTDRQWHVLEVNQAFSALSGLAADAMARVSLHELLALPPTVDAEIAERGGWGGPSELSDRQGELVPVEVNITPLDHGGIDGCGYIVSLSDLREQLRIEARLARMALSDPLTELSNRAAIEQHLAQRFASPSAQPFALVFIDLDGFKEVNDSFGHDVGDQLLRTVAGRLHKLLHPGDFLGRWGGDEFAIVLGPDSGQNEVRSIAQSIIATLNMPVPLDGNEVTVTPSIGAALAPQDGGDFGTLLRKADAAMYLAKERGRNGLAFYDPVLDTDAQRRVRMHSLLRADAERNGFTFVAQPKVDRDGNGVGVELLMRWPTAAFGMVSPVEFIPLAEKTGLIGLMGRHALHAAAQLARRSIDVGQALSVAVNLSPKQLLQRGLEQQLLVACQRAGIEPGMIELEITESALVDNMDVVQPLLRRLRKAGFSLALDDFGTGYSSLSYLRHLPFNKIKIDRSFVLDIDHDPRAARLLAHMVQLCAALGMSTVAEGVETEAQFRTLRDLGVQEFQGYYFARPAPVDDWIAQLVAQPGVAPRLPKV